MKLLELTIFLLISIIINYSNQSISTNFEEFAYSILGNGTMAKSSLTYKEYLNTISNLEKEFPNLISTESIGQTFLNNTIFSIKFKPKYHSNKAILFTGMHHGREPTSMMMNMYILLKLIHMETINKSESSELLENVNVYFIPVINVDAYLLNNELYKTSHNINKAMVRKNRRDDISEFSNCKINENFDSVTVGVDLNRNYGYKFGLDNEGSSGSPCKDDYRGSFAFSEPETKSIKTFIENHPEIKIAFNYHSYGNLLIIPFNYANSQESNLSLFMNYTLQRNIYEEFRIEGHFPDGFKEGNGADTINYKANGEASDWMLGEKKIVSFSPELGVDDQNSNTFYPSKKTLFKILKSNLNSAIYAITRASFYFKFNNLKKKYTHCQIVNMIKYKFLDNLEDNMCLDNFVQFSLQIELHNNGFSDFKGDMEFMMKINSKFLKSVYVKLNTGHVNFNNSNSFGNSNTNKIFEKNYFTKNNITDDSNNLYNETILFNVDFVESLNSRILEIKFYIDQNDLLFIEKLEENFIELKRSNKSENSINYLNGLGLKFNNPEYSLKLSEFEKFDMNISPIKPNNNSELKKEIYKYIQYIIWIVLILIIGVLIYVFHKIRSTHSENNEITPQNQRNPNNIIAYLELESASRDF